jgi:pyruvate/2-oxoglutarate dehydrogenase complex dihydrolipoamide dehydrogenase (E3) component
VPSKALLASARRAALRAHGTLDFPEEMERMRALRAALAPSDSAERFRSLGVDVFFGAARFVGRREAEVEGARLRFTRSVIATGARAVLPPVPGLAESGARTHETVFDLERLPARLLIVGAGAIGCELAQAFARFGASVTVVEIAPRALPREDAAAAAAIAAALERDGVRFRFGTALARVERRGDVRLATLAVGDAEETIEADEVVVAAGRAPRVEGLGLEAAGVRHGAKGIEVDAYLRTSNPRIFAAGDVTPICHYTHAADAAARTAVRNALFPFAKRRMPIDAVPRVVYTDPELAEVGRKPAETAAAGGVSEETAASGSPRLETVEIPFSEVDRARLEGETEGFVRIAVDRASGAIRGATIVGKGAGELVSEIATAMAGGVRLSALAEVIHPYPTRAEAVRKAADAWNRRRLTPRARRWLARYLRFFG